MPTRSPSGTGKSTLSCNHAFPPRLEWLWPDPPQQETDGAGLAANEQSTFFPVREIWILPSNRASLAYLPCGGSSRREIVDEVHGWTSENSQQRSLTRAPGLKRRPKRSRRLDDPKDCRMNRGGIAAAGAESGQVSKPGCNCGTRTSAGNEHEVVTSTPGSVGAAQAKHEVVAINSVPSV